MAIDTWGVDYVLFDKDKKEITPNYAYRDSRTDGIKEEIDKIIPRAELFGRTGIQPINFNTIYQLYCDKKSGKLGKAEHFLMIPEYISYRLTGVMKNEYTNATTGAIVGAKAKSAIQSFWSFWALRPIFLKSFPYPATLWAISATK